MDSLSSNLMRTHPIKESSISEEVHAVAQKAQELEIGEEQIGGWFNLSWLGGGGVKAELQKKREHVSGLEGKLVTLEQNLEKLETRDRDSESPETRMLRDQNTIAIRELIIEVELALTKAIREEYQLRYMPEDAELQEMDSALSKLEGRIHEEGRSVLREDSVLWGIAKLWSKIQDDRHQEVAQEEMTLLDLMGGMGPPDREIKTPESVRQAREAIMEELGLTDIDHLADSLNATGKLERKRMRIQEEVNMLKDTLENHGRVDQLGYQLTSKELNDVRLRILDEEITINELDIALLEIEIDEGREELAFLGQRIDTGQMMIDEANNGVRDWNAEIEEVNKQLKTDRARQKQLIESTENNTVTIDRLQRNRRTLVAKREAQEDVNQLLANDSTVEAFVGGALDKGIEVLGNVRGTIAGTREELTYKWEDTEWGHLLASENAGVMKNFRSAIGTLKKRTRNLKAKRQTLVDRREEIQKKLDSRQWASMENGQEIKAEWQSQIEKLDVAIRQTELAENDTRIAMRAAFLQRLVDSVNERQVALNATTDKLKVVNTDIEELRMQVSTQQERVSSLHGKYKNDAQEVLNRMKTNLGQLETDAQKLTVRTHELNVEVRQLNTGYELQRQKYMVLRPSQRNIMEHMTDMAAQLIPFGLGSNRYKPIKEFDLDKQFADFGYSITDGLKQFGAVEGDNIAGALTGEVNDFLTFMDDYPELAIPMVTDIALTLSFLQDKAPLEHLLTGLRARGYTEALLGQLGRELEVPPHLTAETYPKAAKWKAMADIARYGPMAGNAPRVVQSAFEGYARGGWLGAVLGGAGQAAIGSAQAELTRNVINAMDPASVRLGIGVLAFARGEEPKKVLEEQRNLALLGAVGEAQRAIRKPRSVISGVQRAVGNQWRAFKKAGWGEKAARLVTQVGIPAAGIGGAAGLIFLAATGPVGWVAAIGLAVASLAVAFTLTTVISTSMRRVEPFRSTMDAAKAEYARNHTLNETRINQLKAQRDNYILQLQEKAILLPPRTPVQHVPPIVQQWRDEEHGRLQTIQQAQKQALDDAIAQRRESGAIQVRDIRDLFLEHADGAKLKEKVQEAVEKELAGKGIDLRDQAEIVTEATYRMQQQLIHNWLKEQLDPAFQEDFINMVMQYDSVEQWETAQRQQKEQLERDVALLEENMKKKLRDDLPGNMRGQAESMARKWATESGWRKTENAA